MEIGCKGFTRLHLSESHGFCSLHCSVHITFKLFIVLSLIDFFVLFIELVSR